MTMTENRPRLALAMMALVLLCGCNREKEAREAERAIERSTAERHAANLKMEAENAALEYQIVEMEFGRETAQQWDKCLADPPKIKANQVACAKLLAHIKSVREANDKAEKAKEAKW
jgi:hypothetical protein